MVPVCCMAGSGTLAVVFIQGDGSRVGRAVVGVVLLAIVVCLPQGRAPYI